MCQCSSGQCEVCVGEDGDFLDRVYAVDEGYDALHCQVPGVCLKTAEADSAQWDVIDLYWRRRRPRREQLQVQRV